MTTPPGPPGIPPRPPQRGGAPDAPAPRAPREAVLEDGRVIPVTGAWPTHHADVDDEGNERVTRVAAVRENQSEES